MKRTCRFIHKPTDLQIWTQTIEKPTKTHNNAQTLTCMYIHTYIYTHHTQKAYSPIFMSIHFNLLFTQKSPLHYYIHNIIFYTQYYMLFLT